MRVLVDGDILIFRACFAAERMEYAVEYLDGDNGEDVRLWCENKANADELMANLGRRGVKATLTSQRKLEPFSHAVKNLRNIIENIEERTSAGSMVIVVSGGDNFRDHVATIKPYKGNRDKAHRPTYEHEMREYILDNFESVRTENEEADDYMGYTQTAAIAGGDVYASCIASADKDLLMIPGLSFNFLKDDAAARLVSPEEALDTFFKQWLTGDPTDNIPGVPKIGPKKAEAILENPRSFEDMLGRVRDSYIVGYGESWEEAMIENGRLIWIRRKPHEMFDVSVLRSYFT